MLLLAGSPTVEGSNIWSGKRLQCPSKKWEENCNVNNASFNIFREGFVNVYKIREAVNTGLKDKHNVLLWETSTVNKTAYVYSETPQRI